MITSLRYAAHFAVLTIIIILASIPTELCAQQIKPEQPVSTDDTLNVVNSVIELYESGNISQAEYQALKILDYPEGLSHFDRFTLYRILAFCAVANDDEEGGVRQFVAALRLNPSLTPDLITWSPKIRRVYDRARVQYERQEQVEISDLWAKNAGICRQASFKSLYMPGAGQFRKGHKTKGSIVSILFWGAAATFIYSQIAIPRARDRYDQARTRGEAVDRYKEYENLIDVSVISLGITIAVYNYAFFDALWSNPPARPSSEGQ